MLCFRFILLGIALVALLIPGAFLVGIIGRVAGFRPGHKPGTGGTVVGWFGIIFLSSIMLGICIFAGLIDWGVSTIVVRVQNLQANPAQPQPIPGITPTPKLIPAAWNEADMAKTFLSDMQELNPRVGWGNFGKNGKLGYDLPIGNDIRVDNKFYPNSLSMHPPSHGHSSVTYRLERKMKLFKAWAAYNDTEHAHLNPNTLATFVVRGDGVYLWASSPLQKGAMETCRISVEGVDAVELQVHCPGDFANVRAVWLEPHVLR
jgi:hypothetical protein